VRNAAAGDPVRAEALYQLGRAKWELRETAASIVRVANSKSVDATDDYTLVLADLGVKAIEQLEADYATVGLDIKPPESEVKPQRFFHCDLTEEESDTGQHLLIGYS